MQGTAGLGLMYIAHWKIRNINIILRLSLLNLMLNE